MYDVHESVPDPNIQRPEPKVHKLSRFRAIGCRTQGFWFTTMVQVPVRFRASIVCLAFFKHGLLTTLTHAASSDFVL